MLTKKPIPRLPLKTTPLTPNPITTPPIAKTMGSVTTPQYHTMLSKPAPATPTGGLKPTPITTQPVYGTTASTKPVTPIGGGLKPTPIKTQPVVRPMSAVAPISSVTEAEVKRKALAGEALANPSASKTAMYDRYRTQAIGGNFANAQKGYGLGYAQDNLGGGFSGFGDEQALATERGRIATVMANRTKAGLSNTGYDQYLARLGTASSPFDEANKRTEDARSSYEDYSDKIHDSSKGYRDEYNGSQAKQDATKWASATIEDIAKKYGFDYSRDYAKQQAEAEAQALRNANEDAKRRNESNKKTGNANIDNNLMNMAEGLDRDYFQRMMAQQQGQVSSGLNGGIASDQDLRLQMNRQAEMGASYRDANLGKMKIDENFNLDDIRLTEQGGLINQQALAREDSLYNTRLQEGFGNLMTEREMANARDQQEWSKMFSEIGRNDGLDQQEWGRSQSEIDRATQDKRFLTEDGQWNREFEYGQAQDAIQNDQWNKQFGYQQGRDKVDDYQWSKEFRQGVDNDSERNRQWSKEFLQGSHEYTTDNAWREYTFKNMSATEKAQLEQNASQFGEDMAWKLYDQEYQGELAKGQYSAEIEGYTGSGGNFNGGGAQDYGLGALSRTYESSGNPAIIANNKGDLGGKSYGTYQLTKNSGNAQKFASQYGGLLKGKTAGTASFDSAWKAEAKKNPKAFADAQHNYIKRTHYDPVVKGNEWIMKYPKAVQDAIWSTAVQHGVGGARNILNRVARVGMTPETMINAIYSERGRNNGKAYFPSSNSTIQRQQVARFEKEKRDALAMLKK